MSLVLRLLKSVIHNCCCTISPPPQERRPLAGRLFFKKNQTPAASRTSLMISVSTFKNTAGRSKVGSERPRRSLSDAPHAREPANTSLESTAIGGVAVLAHRLRLRPLTCIPHGIAIPNLNVSGGGFCAGRPQLGHGCRPVHSTAQGHGV